MAKPGPHPPIPLATWTPHPGEPGHAASDLGFKAFKKGQFAEAIQHWSNPPAAAMPALKPALAEAYFRRAMLATDRSMAIQDLLAAIGATPEDGRCWYHLGLAHHRDGDLDGAEEAYGRAERLGYPRREPLGYLQGLLALEREPAGQTDALPDLGHQDLLAPIHALLRQDWAALAAMPPFASHAKGTPAAPGMAGLLRGIGQVGLEQWTAGAQTLGSLSKDLFPPAVEGLRVVFLGRALDRLGRSAEARKLRLSTLARTGLATLGADLAEGARAELASLLEAGHWAQAARTAEEFLKAYPYPWARVAAAIGPRRRITGTVCCGPGGKTCRGSRPAPTTSPWPTKPRNFGIWPPAPGRRPLPRCPGASPRPRCRTARPTARARRACCSAGVGWNAEPWSCASAGGCRRTS